MFDDLAVAVPYSDAAGLNSGRVYVFLGAPVSGAAATAACFMDGDMNDWFGVVIAR